LTTRLKTETFYAFMTESESVKLLKKRDKLKIEIWRHCGYSVNTSG